jgi:hypothetical protein
MAAIAVEPKSIESGDAVQWLGTPASFTEVQTLVGEGSVRRKGLERSNLGIEVFFGGLWYDVNQFDYVFVGSGTQRDVFTPAQFAKFYQLAD